MDYYGLVGMGIFCIACITIAVVFSMMYKHKGD